MGNAIMSFYSALIDLLGRCAPEMHVRLSMATVTGATLLHKSFLSVIVVMGRLETQTDIPSSSSSTRVKGKRSEFAPSFALWFRLSTWWESSASLQKCPWLIKVRRDEEPRTCFGRRCGLLFHFGGFSSFILLYWLIRWLRDGARHVGLFLPGPQGSHGALPGASVQHSGPELSDAHAGGRLPA